MSYIFDVSKRDKSARRASLRWVLSHLASSKIRFLYMILGSLSLIAINTAIPYYVGIMIDDAILKKNKVLLTRFILLFIILGISKIVINYLNIFNNNRVSWNAIKNVRIEFFEKIQSKPLEFHNRIASGDLMALATQDMSMFGVMINPGISMIASAFVGLAMVIFFSSSVNLVYTLLLFPFFIAYLFSIQWYNKSMNPISQLFNHKWSLISRSAQESITGVQVVRSFNGEEYEINKFKDVVDDFKIQWYKRQLLTAKYYPLLVIYVTIGFSFILSIYFYTLNLLTFGEIISINGMLLLLVQPTFIISFAVNMFQQGLAGGERIFHTLYATESEEREDQDFTSWDSAKDNSIKFENVNFKYEGSEKVILNNINFEVKPNETVAIVGPTGSGKTSLTKLLSRFYDYEGKIYIGGVDIQEFRLRDLRQKIGRVEQDIFLFSTTIKENITFGIGDRVVNDEDIELAAKTAQAHDFITSTEHGYETILGERGTGLSGGQKQRIAIARCILTDPKILILDDSTSAIDSKTEEKISEAMNFVMQDRTTFLITHRLSAIRKADKIIVLMNGTIVDVGTHDDLLQRSKAYRRIFKTSIDLPPIGGAI